MTESPNDESINDAKRNANKPEPHPVFSNKMSSFLIVVFGILLVILLHVSYGGLILFACKVAASKMLPTDLKKPPYTNGTATNADPTINEATVDATVDKSNDSAIKAVATPLPENVGSISKAEIQKVKIPIFLFGGMPLDNDNKTISPNFDQMPDSLFNKITEDNAKNTLLDAIRAYKNSPDSSFVGNYYYSICEAVINLNYKMFNCVLQRMNKWWDGAVILFGPMILSIALSFMSIISFLNLIYQMFAKMGWFFKRNTNPNKKTKPKWETIPLSPFNTAIYWSIFMLWLCIMLTSLIFVPPFTIIPSLIIPLSLLICIISILSYKAVSDNTGTKTITSLTALKEVFVHYKPSIVKIYSTIVTFSAFSVMGIPEGIAAIVTIGILYATTSIFSPINSGGVDAKVVTDAKVVVPAKVVPYKFDGGGASFAYKLKQLSKKLARNNT